LLRRNQNPKLIREVIRDLLLIPSSTVLPTLWNLVTTPAGYSELPLLFTVPGFDFRTCPQAQRALESATSSPSAFIGSKCLMKMAKEQKVSCERPVAEMLLGNRYEKQKGPSFEIILVDTIMQIMEYRIRGIPDMAYPTAWKVEGTMNGKVWFVVHAKNAGPELGSPNEKIIRLKHMSPPLKVIRFTQLESSDQSDLITLMSFEISEGSHRPAKFGKPS
jgi:hypothetical protein